MLVSDQGQADRIQGWNVTLPADQKCGLGNAISSDMFSVHQLVAQQSVEAANIAAGLTIAMPSARGCIVF